jgi:hypothetical protein
MEKPDFTKLAEGIGGLYQGIAIVIIVVVIIIFAF